MPKTAKKAKSAKAKPAKKTKKGGGPRGGAKLPGLSQFSLYMPDTSKAKIARLAKKTGKSQTEIVCDAVAKLKG